MLAFRLWSPIEADGWSDRMQAQAHGARAGRRVGRKASGPGRAHASQPGPNGVVPGRSAPPGRRRHRLQADSRWVSRRRGAVLTLSTMVTARIATTTPSDTRTGILMTSMSSILVPMKARITARP